MVKLQRTFKKTFWQFFTLLKEESEWGKWKYSILKTIETNKKTSKHWENINI